jgi:hypothetical protein
MWWRQRTLADAPPRTRASKAIKLMSELGVRRGKAVISSGCKTHPANAPAGSNRSSHGDDEMAQAIGIPCHEWVVPCLDGRSEG